MSEGTTACPTVERVADILWARLDLNGHTKEGVRRTAAYIVEAISPHRASGDGLDAVEAAFRAGWWNGQSGDWGIGAPIVFERHWNEYRAGLGGKR